MTRPNDHQDLDALIDGALGEEREAELLRLIEQDDALRREYESRRRVVEAVRGLPRSPASEALRERLRDVATLAPESSEPRSSGLLLRFSTLMSAAAAVMIAVLLAVRDDPMPGALPDEARAGRKDGELASEQATSEDRKLVGKADREESVDFRELKDRPAKSGFGKAEEVDAEAESEAADADAVADDAGGERRPVSSPPARPKRARAARTKKTPGRLEKTAEPVAKELAKKKPAVRDLLARVQHGAPLLTAKDLNAYLTLLTSRKDAEVARHIEAFGVPVKSVRAPAAEGKGAGAGGGLLGTGRRPPLIASGLASREEARVVAALLKRAFPARRPGASAKAKSGAPAAAGILAGKKGGKQIFEILVTPMQVRIVQNWLSRLAPTRDRRRDGGQASARVGGGFSGAKPKPTRHRVELAFPPPESK